MKLFVDKFQYHLISERYLSNNTVDAYMKDIAQFLDFLRSNISIMSFQDVKLQNIKDFLKHLRFTLKVSPRSASRKLSALKAFSNYLHKHHNIPLFTNGAIFPRLPKHLPKNLTEKQIETIIVTANQDRTLLGHRNKVLVSLLYACGMRVSELVNLHIEHINFVERYVRVVGKGSKERIIPLHAELIPLLKEYIEKTHPQLLAASKLSTSKLFPIVLHKKTTYLTRQSVFSIIKSIASKAGLVHSISPHVLRHSLATHLLKNGANLRVLQTLLGHEKLTTVQIYTHVDVSHLRDLYDKYHPRSQN